MSDPFAHSRLTGQVAVITGAAQGIGEATARLFAARGIAGLLLTDRNAALGEAVAGSLNQQGTKAVFVAADLAEPAQVARIIPAAEAAFGRVDILCNIAGNTERGSIVDTDLALFDRIFAINIRAPFFLTQDAVRLMQRERIEGAVVNILSVNAHGGAAFLAPYSASKGALLTLTRNTANALLWDRIRVNGLILGWADTPGEHAVRGPSHTGDWLAEAESGRPFGRLIKPDEVARAVAYLASGESGLMTGAIIDFDQTVLGAFPGTPRPKRE